MKLTAEQIEFIDSILLSNGIMYDDVKLEMMDHMASEIEILMEENALPFEENFKLVLDKWKPQLQLSFSGLIGFSNPKIITSKCHDLIKNQLLFALFVAGLLTCLVLFLISYSTFNSMFKSIEQVFKSFIVVEFCLVILSLGLVWSTKRQTTYSYLMKKKGLGVILFLFMIGIGMFPAQLNHPDFKIAFVTIFISIIYVVMGMFYLQFALKHFQFERKLKNN
ncbi:uncharacterized membrane protein YciS (DUF1049 family) [Flavobacterium sp. CG_9.1]|uniref:Uncharacterized protein n=1 Tax=Flavobacterium xanthum TaxID=69322 RepID=A0A1M7FUV5_9FLAO|nr:MULTISPECIES: hypothetical protein [Flavobacterium]MBG6063389.1 uncharacterized membrane protein YciS (DUF1049 family) [Flavobacterium sp. CG_9.1]SHM07851.1 hypothetical protein SAMN05443669_102156 [Flavobacterium xanthum]